MREILIILVILIIIICGAIFTQEYLNNTSNMIVSGLENLKYSIEQGNVPNQELMKKSEEIYKNWDNMNKQWSNIILHEEIDLIETALIRMKSKIKTGQLDESLEDIDTSIFLVNHINEKEKTSLKNIF